MTYIKDLWPRMFKRKISFLEEEVLKELDAEIGHDDRLFLLAAILVRTISLLMVESEASPFKILPQMGKAVEENRVAIARVTETYVSLLRELEELKSDTKSTRAVLHDARDMARGRSGVYHHLYGHLPLPPRFLEKKDMIEIALIAGGASLTGAVITVLAVIFFL